MFRRLNPVPEEFLTWVVTLIWLHIAAGVIEMTGLYTFDWFKMAWLYPLLYVVCVLTNLRPTER